MEDKKRGGQAWPLAALLLTGLAVYANTLQGPFHFDDNLSIVDNPALRNLGALKDIWSFWPTRFVTYLSFAVNYHFHQLQVAGYHLVNGAIHLAAAVLVWRLGLLTFATPALRGQKIAADAGLVSFMAGLIFVAHPIQTQAVTYIVQRAASLAAFFYLASVCLYVKARLLEGVPGRGGMRYFCYGGALAAGAVAMFSKEMAVTLPLMIGLYEISFFKKEGRLEGKRLAPFFILALLVPLAMVLTGSAHVGELRRSGEPLANMSPLSYLLTQFKVIPLYLKLLLIPAGQNIDHDISVARSFSDPRVLAGLFLVASVLVAAGRLFRGHRLMSFGLFWFFLALLPESSVIPIRDVIFEHRLYLPMAGFSFFLAAALHSLFKKKGQGAMVAAGVLIIAGYSCLAHARNAVWRSELALWDDAARKSPRKARPFNNRGLAYARDGAGDKALADFETAIRLDPNFAEAYNNRGSVYLGMAAVVQAITDYDLAIEKGPRYAEAYHNRGLAYANQGDPDRAILDYNKALEIRPAYAEAYYDRGNVYYRSGDFERAILDYDRAISLKPRYAEAYNNRGSAFYSLGDAARAAADYSRALELRPDYVEARNNRASVKP